MIEAQARITEIQSRFAWMATGAPTAATAPAAPAATRRATSASDTADAADGAGGSAASGTSAPQPGTGKGSFSAALETVLVQRSVSVLPAGSPHARTHGRIDGDDVVAEALRHLGTPYRWGGETPGKGLDCSGLTSVVFDKLGIDLPRVSRQQALVGDKVADLRQARPGDLLFFGSPVDHVGIYTGDGKMIHAPRPGRVVSHERVYTTPVAIRRVLPAGGGAAPAPVKARSTGGIDDVPYADLFRRTASRYGLDPALLAGVAKVESGYNPRAVSPAGARGLMQLMPATARGLDVNPLDPAQAVDGAARLLRSHLRAFGGSLELALAAYNAGPGAVHRYGGIPPYAETRAYVPKVIAAMKGARS